MKHEMVHDLSLPLARKAADCAYSTYKQRYARFSPILRWLNDRRAELTFSAMGIEMSAMIELEPKTIAVDLKVPFVLRPFRRRAISVIERELKYWIDRAKTDQL